jgi:hypothetical protein
MEGEFDPNTMEDALCAREELQANRLKLHENRTLYSLIRDFLLILRLFKNTLFKYGRVITN